MAWGIAVICIILVLLTSARPEWFDFSTSPKKPTTKQAWSTSAKHTSTRQQEMHLKIRAKLHTNATKKTSALHSKAKASPASVEKQNTMTGGFYIQLGAFHERQSAQGLADLLKRKGLMAIIVAKPDGLHAVWVGPKKTRGEAETLRKAIHLKLKTKAFIIHQKQL